MKHTAFHPAIPTLLLAAPCALAIQPPADDAPPPPPVNAEVQPAAEAVEIQAPKPAAQGFLGITCDVIPDVLNAHLDLPDDKGVLVLAVMPQSPAATAGILTHDIILSIDDEPVATHEELSEKTLARKPGDTVRVQLLRKGRTIDVDAILGERLDADALLLAPQRNPLENLLFDGMPMDQANRLRDLIERNQRALGDAGGMFNDNGFLDALRGMEEQMRNLLDAPPNDDEDIQGPFGRVRMNVGATVRLMDEHGSVEIKSADDSKEVTVRDRENEIIWSGPWDTDQDKAAAPPDVRERIERLNLEDGIHGGGLRFNFQGGGNR